MWIKHHWLLSKRAYLIQNATVLAILWFWQRKVFHNRVLLILFQGSAQWLALNAMELVTSRLSAEEVNREPPLRRAQRVWWHVWRWGWGTCELRYCRPILGVSQSVPRGSPSTRTLSFRSLFRRTAAKGLTAPSRSSGKPEPGAEPHMLICTAERSAPAGRGQGWGWD